MAVNPAVDTSALPDKAAFAAANGWRYEAAAPAPAYSGALFEFLQQATVADRFSTTSGPLVEVGVITGKVGGSQSYPPDSVIKKVSFQTDDERTVGYLAVRLERKLPQFVLDAKLNDEGISSSIPMPIAGGQQLSLEGDFDRHFTLYCPKGYERDALYIFTPDLMALLIDEAGDFDVEIADDMFFVYARDGFDLADAALWERLDRIRRLVGAKAITQTDLYADERVKAGIATEEGSRLRINFFDPRNRVGRTVILTLLLVVVLVVIAEVAFLGVFGMGF